MISDRIALGLMGALATALIPTQVRSEVAVFKVDIGLPNTVSLMVRGAFDGDEVLRVKSAMAEINQASASSPFSNRGGQCRSR